MKYWCVFNDSNNSYFCEITAEHKDPNLALEENPDMMLVDLVECFILGEKVTEFVMTVDNIWVKV